MLLLLEEEMCIRDGVWSELWVCFVLYYTQFRSTESAKSAKGKHLLK